MKTATNSKTTPYDADEHLRTPEEIALYLEACLEEADDDAAFVVHVLGVAARAWGASRKKQHVTGAQNTAGSTTRLGLAG